MGIMRSMSDLFQKRPKETAYTAHEIEVLEGLEPVRHRPGMYIGGTDEKALHHLAVEVIDNAMDEAVAGHANHIKVEFLANGSLIISDNGRGIPVDAHPKFPDKSALEVILTTLHAGGKFSNKVYETAGGLHGVGISVVNALSDHLYVEVVRNETLWAQTYSRGFPQTPLENKGRLTNRRGTRMTFHPDPEIFGEGAGFEAARLYQIVRAKAYLHRGVEIRWVCAPEKLQGTTPAEESIRFPGGLKDYLTHLTADTTCVTQSFFTGENTLPEGQGRLEWAIAWPQDEEPQLWTYCNTIPTPQGGTHEAGFRGALTRSIRDYAERMGNKKAAQIAPEDIMGGAYGLLSVFIKNAQFQGQTKEKLVTPGVTRLVENAIKDLFDLWLGEQREDAVQLLEHILQRAEERLNRRKSRETARKSATQRLRLPGKLADCASQDRAGTELFLVEGDSAGGSAKQARDRKTQAILPLRGKILNVANATSDKKNANQELQDLGIALGCGSGKNCDPEKLRYERVIIMTDADVDGAHIAALLMTYFFREMRPIVTRGHLYLACPPLYRLTQGNKVIYAHDDADKERLLKTAFRANAQVEISRFKGLGEMPAPQLRETTMNPATRKLLQVKISPEADQEYTFATTTLDEFVEDLMGKRPEKRFSFIQRHAQFATDLDL